jgi:hypothetical protein
MGVMPRTYHTDHTAHLRHQAKTRAKYGACGLVTAAAAAGVLTIVGARAGASAHALRHAALITVAVLAVLSRLFMLVNVALWAIHRRNIQR